MRTISFNDNDSAVYDVQCRLRALGYELQADSFFGQKTREAVRAFRKKQGLPAADTVDEATWNALVDATFTLGDRILYLRMPYFHGQDVFALQDILNVLGFITDEKDGIFGAHTEKALREFQASTGIIDDGIAGASTFDAIERLRHAWEDKQAANELADEQNHAGFARAFEALQKMEACFYGLDTSGRTVAVRIANLARATSETARVTCADELGGIPHQTMLLIGLSTTKKDADKTKSPANAKTFTSSGSDSAANIVFSPDFAFTKRLSTALKAIGSGKNSCLDKNSSSDKNSRRLIIEIPDFPKDLDKDEISQDQWHQHLAVLLLDAFCLVFSK